LAAPRRGAGTKPEVGGAGTAGVLRPEMGGVGVIGQGTTAARGAVAEQGTRDGRSRSRELPLSWLVRRGAGEPLRLPTRWGSGVAA
jgi:hypothetical protein